MNIFIFTVEKHFPVHIMADPHENVVELELEKETGKMMFRECMVL